MTTLRDLLSNEPPPVYFRGVAICDNYPPAMIIGDDGETIQRVSTRLVLSVPLVEYGPGHDYANKAISERIAALLEGSLLERQLPDVASGDLLTEMNRQMAPLQTEVLLCGEGPVAAIAEATGLPVIRLPYLEPSLVIGVPGPMHLGHDFHLDGKHGLAVFASWVAACKVLEAAPAV